MGLKTLASFVLLLQCTEWGNAHNYKIEDMGRFQFFLDSLDWFQASQQCEVYNKTLVNLTNMPEEKFIKETLLPNLQYLNYALDVLNTREFWIGNSQYAVFHTESENLQSPAFGSGCKPFLCVHDELDYDTCYVRTTITGDIFKGANENRNIPCSPKPISEYMESSEVIALSDENTKSCKAFILDSSQRPTTLTLWLKNILMPSTNTPLSDYPCVRTTRVDVGDTTSEVDGTDYTSQVYHGDSTTPADDSSSQVDDDGTQSEYSAQKSYNSAGKTPPLTTIPREINTSPGRITTPLSSVPPQIAATPVMKDCHSTCACFNRSVASENITVEELLQSMLQNREQLIVNRETLSSWKRKHYSAQDTRASSTTIGYIGAAVIGMMIGFLAMMDLPDIVIALRPDCRRKWKRQKKSTAKGTQTGQAKMNVTPESEETGIAEMKLKGTPTAGHFKTEMISVDERSRKKSMECFMTQPTSYSKTKCRKVYSDSCC